MVAEALPLLFVRKSGRILGHEWQDVLSSLIQQKDTATVDLAGFGCAPGDELQYPRHIQRGTHRRGDVEQDEGFVQAALLGRQQAVDDAEADLHQDRGDGHRQQTVEGCLHDRCAP